MNKIVLLLILVLYLFPLNLSANAEILYKANSLYEQGTYSDAIDLYNQAVKLGTINGDIYYNIGNSYFRLGHLGEAIFYYKLALRYNPENGDIKFNLNWAQSKTIDKIQDQKIISSEKIANYIPINLKDSFYLLAIFSLLFWGTLTLSLFKSYEWIKWIKISTFTLFILLTIITALKFVNNGREFGVIVNQEANIYSATGKDNVVLFTLHQGAEFEINDQLINNNQKWYQITLVDGKKGWLKSSDSISTYSINN
ncbi:MAG: tetratricopeptide repeat protein [Oligoflexia bacterium]|nr:tetratricopeptide repeat protein [Oligoflexia bacterium]